MLSISDSYDMKRTFQIVYLWYMMQLYFMASHTDQTIRRVNVVENGVTKSASLRYKTRFLWNKGPKNKNPTIDLVLLCSYQVIIGFTP